MQRQYENTPRWPLSTFPSAVRQTLYHSPGPTAGTNEALHAQNQTVINMGEVNGPQESLQCQPLVRSTPWDATSNNIPHPSYGPTPPFADHFLHPSVLTPPATSYVPTHHNQLNVQGPVTSVQPPATPSQAFMPLRRQ